MLSPNLYFLDENSGTNQLIYTADSIDSTKTVYSLQPNSNDDASSFLINSEDGELRFNLNPDYEQKSLYTAPVLATDAAGNTSAKTIYLKINDLDDKASSAPNSLDLTDLFDSGNSKVDNLTSITSPRFTGQAEALSSIDLLVDGVSVGLASANSSGAWSFVIPASKSLLDGPHIISASAVDDSGNRSELSDPLSITIDTKSPIFTSSGQFEVVENHGADQVVFTALATDDSDVSYYLKQSLNDDASQFTIHPISGDVRLSHNPDFESQASYGFTVVAEDSAGNNTDLKIQLNVIDVNDTPPPIPSAPDLLAVSDTGQSDHDNLTLLTTPTFSGTSEEDTYVELLADGRSLGSTQAASDGRWQFQVPAPLALSDGQHIITVRSSYVEEYPSDYSEELLIVIDSSAPSFISGSVANSIAEDTGANQRIYNAITPDASDVRYALKTDNADDAELFTLNTSSGQVRLKSDPNFDSQSTYSFTVVATDSAGNSSFQPVTLDIIDPNAPAFIPAYAWTDLFGNQSFDAGQAIHLGQSGSAVVAGNTYVVDDDSNEHSFDYFISKYLSDGSQAWSWRYGANDNDLAYDITTGSVNEIYVTGVTASPQLYGEVNSGYKDFFLSKFTSDGVHLWTRLGGSSGEEIGYATTTSRDGYVYVTGSTTSDGGEQSNHGGKDIFVAKYTSGGELIWHKLYGTDQDDVAFDVVSGPNSELFIAGFTEKDLNSERNLGESDGFVMRLDGDGQIKWVRTIGSRGNDLASTLVADQSGNIFVAGNIGPEFVGDDLESDESGSDLFVSSFTFDGDQSWIRTFGSTHDDSASSLALADNGTLYLSSTTHGALSGESNNGYTDVTIHALSNDGSSLWNFQTGSSLADYASDLVVTSEGRLILVGSTNGDFNNQLNQGTRDMILHSVSLVDAHRVITLSNDFVVENSSVDSPIATINAIDPFADSGASFSVVNFLTYSLTPGPGDADNQFFSLEGNQLKLSNSPDHEIKSRYDLRVKVEESSGTYSEQALVLHVTDVNEAPTGITLSTTKFDEDTKPLQNIASLTAVDQDDSDVHSFQLVNGEGDDDNDSFELVANQLSLISAADHETQDSYSIRLSVTDRDGLSSEHVITLSVTDVNESPTDIQISQTIFPDTAPLSSVIAELSTTDPDSDDRFRYVLVSGPGSDDNSVFRVAGNKLKLKQSLRDKQDTYKIRLRTVDKYSKSFEKTFELALSYSPEQIILSSLSFDENLAENSEIAMLSSIDGNIDDEHTYELIAGKGDTDNSAFTVSGDRLLINNLPDYEIQDSYSIRLRSTDQSGLAGDQSFVLSVNDLEEPTVLTSSSLSIPENVEAGTSVAFISASNPDPDLRFTIALVSGPGDDDNQLFSIGNGSLRILSSPNYEEKSEFSLRFRAADQHGQLSEHRMVLSVADLNEKPTKILSSSTAINENASVGDPIATLSTIDPDFVDSFTYKFVVGSGSQHNSLFSIEGDQLILSQPLSSLDLIPEYFVRLRSLDKGGDYVYQVF